MAQELKIRINDSNSVEKKLQLLGASFTEEFDFTDTYFNQPKGNVLKLANINKHFFLQRLKAIKGKFDLIEKQSITSPTVEKTKIDLTKKYGIKRILKGKRKNYQLGDLTITLNFIQNVGKFLIVTGENPTEEFITDKIGIKKPEYVRVSFDEIPPNLQDK